MNNKRILNLIVISGLLAGCTLETPKECIEGQHKCHRDGDGYLYDYCTTEGKWEHHTCNLCENNECKEFEVCGSEFVPTCSNNANGIGFIESCVDGRVKPAAACPYLAACRDDHSCGIGIDVGDGCKDDDTLCVSVQGSYHLGTCKGNRWMMSLCPSGEICIDGKHCGVDKPKEAEPDICDTENALVCKDVTENGETYGMIHVCRDGVWLMDSACPGHMQCDGDICGDPDPCLAPNLICGENLCINPKKDEKFCGAKGNCRGKNAGEVCLSVQECRDGVCTCLNDEERVCIDVTGVPACIDYKTNDLLCGCNGVDAGVDCTKLPNVVKGHCMDSVCRYESCTSGYGNCDKDVTNGCEENIKDNETGLNCGGCGDDFKCSIENMKSASCVDGACSYQCEEGFTLCKTISDDGKVTERCVNTADDINNCGFCGNACEASQDECRNGFCVYKDSCGTDGYVEGLKVSLRDGTVKTVKAYCVDSYDRLKYISGQYYGSSFNAEIPLGNTDHAYILMNDIVLTDDYKSIGTSEHPFTGIFLGNGKKITSEVPLSFNEELTGVFGVTEGAFLDGFNLDYEASVINDKEISNVGLLAGYVKDTDVRRSIARSSKLSAQSFAGILVGLSYQSYFKWNRTSGYIESYPEGTEENPVLAIIGGLVGDIRYKSVMEDCGSSAEVSIINRYAVCAGGLVGYLENSDIYSSFATGNVSGYHGRLGGLIGSICYNESTVDGCYATGDVTDLDPEHKNPNGGLFGHSNTSIKIKNSYATGSVTGGKYAGGLAGIVTKSSDISGCYASGNVSDALFAGGLIGDSYALSINESFALGKVSGINYAGGLLGRQYGGNVIHSRAEGSVILTGRNEDNYVGGFVGVAYDATIEDCYTKSKAASPHKGYCGGFAGWSESSVFHRDQAYGDVNCYGTAGGFAGTSLVSKSGVKSEFEECGSYGEFVRGDVAAGGFIGQISDDCTISYCASLTDVMSPRTRGSSVSGGFVGISDDGKGQKTIKYSYSYGSVDEKNTALAGAFIGSESGKNKVVLNHCFYYSNACFNFDNDSVCGTGLGEGSVDPVSSYGGYNFKDTTVETVEGGVKIEKGKSLEGQLNESGNRYGSLICDIKVGIAGSYVFPVLLSIMPDFCKQADAE